MIVNVVDNAERSTSVTARVTVTVIEGYDNFTDCSYQSLELGLT